MIYLVGNKVDLNHMQAVKTDAHFRFAKENSIKSYFCSAKTGDQVTPIFHRVAANLCGLKLSSESA